MQRPCYWKRGADSQSAARALVPAHCGLSSLDPAGTSDRPSQHSAIVVGQAILPAAAFQSAHSSDVEVFALAGRRLKAGGSPDWLPHRRCRRPIAFKLNDIGYDCPRHTDSRTLSPSRDREGTVLTTCANRDSIRVVQPTVRCHYRQATLGLPGV
jgi:hypothetical protein